MENFAVILAGGKGERFWPASRKNRPKQLLRLISDKTMLEETISRVNDLVESDNVLIVTGSELKTLITEGIPSLKPENFLVEPFGRNSAPAIGYAAANIIKRYGDGIMFVLSSDHLIDPVETFVEALKAGRTLAEKHDRLVLLGIEPSRPETGYGYIEIGDITEKTNGFTAYDVAVFKEKPNRILAQEYYLDGQHLWNSGIFIWRAGKIMEEIEKNLPELYDGLDKYSRAIGTKNEDGALERAFDSVSPISIDYGVLEKSHSVIVLRAKFTWDDVGSYSALERIINKDHEGNIKRGEEIHLFDSYETMVLNNAEGPVVTCGISDVVIVRENDMLFIIHKSRVPQMRDLLVKVKNIEDFEEYL